MVDTAAARDLAEPFSRWVSRLATRDMSPNTRAAYVADMAILGTCLAHALGRPEPTVDPDAVAADRRLQRLAAAGMRPRNVAVAEAALADVRPADLTPRVVEDVLALHAAGRAPATRARARIALNQFCRFLVRNSYLGTNPMEQLETDRARRRLPKPLEMSTVQRILATIAQPDPRARKPWPGRDLALAAVLTATGVRLAEVMGADVGSVVDGNGPVPLLRVLGKGRKERVIELNEEAAALLRRYLVERSERLGTPAADDPLFVRSDGSRFTPAALRRLVETWYRRAGHQPPQGAVVHAFRHTFATEAVRSGAPLRDLQEVMGHQSLETTAGYLKVLGQAGATVVRNHSSRDALREVLSHRDEPSGEEQSSEK